jgi:hypothetical protein
MPSPFAAENGSMPEAAPSTCETPKENKQAKAYWILRWSRKLRSHISPRFRRLYKGEDCVWTIKIEVLVNDGLVCRTELRTVRALFDTGCRKNLMSRKMASTINVNYSALEGEPILNTLGVDKFRSLGQIERRWSCDNRRFKPKFYEAVWEVSDKDEMCDVIIGRDTIIENRLFKVMSPRSRRLYKDEDCVWTIKIEVLVNDGLVCRTELRTVRALFDTGCRKNLMSRKMASTINVNYSALEGEPILNTLGVDKFRSLGQIERRWSYNNRRFKPKFYEAVWEVSDKDEMYDVIIGRDTIIENKLFKVSAALGRNCMFRDPLHAVLQC